MTTGRVTQVAWERNKTNPWQRHPEWRKREGGGKPPSTWLGGSGQFGLISQNQETYPIFVLFLFFSSSLDHYSPIGGMGGGEGGGGDGSKKKEKTESKKKKEGPELSAFTRPVIDQMILSKTEIRNLEGEQGQEGRVKKIKKKKRDKNKNKKAKTTTTRCVCFCVFV